MSQIAKKLCAHTASVTGIEANSWRLLAKNVMNVRTAAEDPSVPVQTLLRSIMHQFYSQLDKDLQFREHFRAFQESDRKAAHDWSTTLYEDDLLRAELLSVKSGKDLPFHDHPGSMGITLVLSGITRIYYADLEDHSASSQITPLRLTRIRDRLAGEVCWFFEDKRNIHSIEAVTPETTLLVIHLPPVKENQQVLYFPVLDPEMVEGEVLMTRRVKLNALQLKTKNNQKENNNEI